VSGALRLVGLERETYGQAALWRGTGELRALVRHPRALPDGSHVLPLVPAGTLAWVADEDGERVTLGKVEVPVGGTSTLVLER
jgi:hypothetical protein